MKIRSIAAGLIVLAALAGCSSINLQSKTIDYGAKATKAPTLETPPDLTKPAPGEQFVIPDDEGDSGTNYSDYNKNGGTGTVPKTPNKAATVLPALPNVHMERNDTQRWLVVDDTADNVYPQVRDFFTGTGLKIKTDNPGAGIIETDWAENLAKLPQTGLRAIFGKMVDGLYDSGERDMYRARLERTADGKGTAIYLTHYGREEVLSDDKSTSHWQERKPDPELEAAMLQMLAAKLGGVTTPPPANDAAAAESAESNDISGPPPQLKTRPDNTKFIAMQEPFDRSWRRVGLALEKAKFSVTDKNRMRGFYYIRASAQKKEKSWLQKLAFWSKDEAPTSQRYQVRVRELDQGCEVTVTSAEENAMDAGNANTSSTAATAVDDSPRVVEILFQALSGK
ncbi:MAG: outer membrane protein assembly factor BamC [Gallionellaceae bacterium]|jgi:outer membrane protein assembly factor BamC|nr:outer membrane protein assembly factor BamC [Gallionellaceae bacterium]